MTASSAPVTSQGRVHSFDGLRGVAALAVVLHHCFLTVPALFAADSAPSFPAQSEAMPAHGSFAWWLAYSPLHLIWAGTEAVMIFFVLSGFVLARLARSAGFTWRRYYPQRISRLYLPVIVAVAIGDVLSLIVRHGGRGTSDWINWHPPVPTAGTTLHDVTLVGGTSGLITPLWSLQAEVIFSVLLPAYLVGAWLFRRAPLLGAVGLIGLTAIASTAIHNPSLILLPVFGLGVLMAIHWDDIRARTANWPSPVWAFVVVVAVLLLLVVWLTYAVGWHPSLWILNAVGCLGAAILVAALTLWSPTRHLLESTPIQWLGRVSFSLYLIHEPIVVALTTLGGRTRLWLTLPVALIASLLAAQVFYVVAERPLHRMARRIGDAVPVPKRGALDPA